MKNKVHKFMFKDCLRVPIHFTTSAVYMQIRQKWSNKKNSISKKKKSENQKILSQIYLSFYYVHFWIHCLKFQNKHSLIILCSLSEPQTPSKQIWQVVLKVGCNSTEKKSRKKTWSEYTNQWKSALTVFLPSSLT